MGEISRSAWWTLVVVFCWVAQVGPSPSAASGDGDQASRPAAPPIRDNSFLVEEAYNQEEGVVQHICTFTRQRGTGGWTYSFTQEWPVNGARHQLSFTAPYLKPGVPGESGPGPGDLTLNYRYQVLGVTDPRLAFAPRISLALPTGDEQEGRGSGGKGLQVNLPVSLEASRHLVLHSNLGASVSRSARDELGDEADIRAVSAAQSLIWLAHPSLNFMLEAAWSRFETVEGSGETADNYSLFVSPGIRGALNFPSGLQIVPGLAFPIGLRGSDGERAIFFYVSFEHPL